MITVWDDNKKRLAKSQIILNIDFLSKILQLYDKQEKLM